MSFSGRRSLIFVSFILLGAHACAGAQTAPEPQTTTTVESVTNVQAQRDGIEVQAGPAILRIVALRDDIIRVRVAPTSTLPEDASWAVAAEVRTRTVDVQPVQEESFAGFKTGKLEV